MTAADSPLANLERLVGTHRCGQRGRRLLLWVVIPAVIELVAWQSIPLQGGPGLDPSWEASLEMAVHQHLAFGTQVVFTFGPLGFLSVPEWFGTSTWFGDLGLLALANMFLIRFAVATVVFAATRRTYGTLAGALITLVVACYAGPYADLCVLVVVLVGFLHRERTTRETIAVSIGAGAFAAIEALEKVSVGVSGCVLIALFIASLPKGRLVAVAASFSTFVPVLIVAWLITGQSLGTLASYFRGSEQISSGYSAAMQISTEGLWVYVAVLLLALVGVVGGLETAGSFGKRQRAGLVVMWLFFCFSAFKEAFVRSGPGHTQIYFYAMLATLFAFRWQGRHRSLALFAAGVALICGFVTDDLSFQDVVHQPVGIAWAYRNAHDVVDGSDRARLINRARVEIIAVDRLPRAALPLLTGHTVAVYPWENALVWAYNLDWRPIPVLGSYSAYTSWLDRLDASFLMSSRAPSRLIVQNTGGISVDTRLLSFDEPDAAMEIFCRYRRLKIFSAYAILGRGADRCSAPEAFETVHAGWGQTVTVPTPPTARSIVLVKITGVQIAGLESVRNLLLSAPLRFVQLNGSAPRRLIPGTADDGLPLVASPGIDLPGRYSIAPDARTISVSTAGRSSSSDSRSITYSFYAVSVR